MEGHNIELLYQVIGMRKETLTLPEEKIAEIPKERVLEVKDPEAKPFPKKEPSRLATENEEAASDAEWQAYRAEKAEWEKNNAVVAGTKLVTVNAPVLKVRQAKMDGQELRIFLTVRGPIMGSIIAEDSTRATIYSPAYLDPNSSPGRLQYIPVAFCGFTTTIYKLSCLGESVPQQAEVYGYPTFVRQNENGDYQYRMRAAYHSLDADIPADARTVSIDTEVRAAQEGLHVTSDSREQHAVNRKRRVKQAANVV